MALSGAVAQPAFGYVNAWKEVHVQLMKCTMKQLCGCT